MMFTRWKLLTGVLGFSIGGWATLGNTGEKKVDVPPPPVVAPAAPPIQVAAAPALPTLPALPPAAISDKPNTGTIPGFTPAGVFVPDLDVPIRTPSKVVELPGLPMPETKPAIQFLSKPLDLSVVPAGDFELPKTPSVTPPSLPTTPKAAVDTVVLPKPTPPVEPMLPVVEYTKPVAPPAALTPPPAAIAPSSPPPAPPAVLTPPPAPPISVAPSKFRIVLRVGAGDPSFEVRHDDDLVMKVVCEKVDIKSPERGQGPSNVTATGKVRFVGFGAEGTCDSFSFLAGTGEVSLTGNVNVKVRDKIGRVESELQAEKMQYKLDQTALTGVLKP